MHLLICNSNMFVPIVLTTLLENPMEQYIVYTDQDGMYKLFKELAVPNSITLRYYNAGLLNVCRNKKAMLSQLSKYNIKSITFYHTEYGEYANWLIGKYSSLVNIFFQPPYKTWELVPAYDLKSLVRKIKTYLIYGYNSDIILVGSKRYVSMAKSFYKKNNIIKIGCCINNAIISQYVGQKYSFNDKQALVWLDGAIIAGGVDPNGYQKICDEIITYIGVDKVYSKCHPRFDDLYGIEKDLKQIPSYIPISLLLNNFDTYVGYWSTALVEAAIAGKKAISTIYIMPQKQSGRIETERKVLDDKLDGKGIILYPRSTDELKEMIKLSIKN